MRSDRDINQLADEHKACPQCQSLSEPGEAICNVCGFQFPAVEPERTEWVEVGAVLGLVGAFGVLWAAVGLWPALGLASFLAAALFFVEVYRKHWNSYNQDRDE